MTAGDFVRVRRLPAWGVGRIREVLGLRFVVYFDELVPPYETEFVEAELELILAGSPQAAA